MSGNEGRPDRSRPNRPGPVVVIGADARPGHVSTHVLAVLEGLRERNPDRDAHVILLRGGPEIHRFHHLAPTTVVEWFDRRDDNREMAGLVRNRPGRRILAGIIDRLSSAALPRRLPDVPGATTLLCGWEVLVAAPLPARTPGELLASRGRPRDLVVDLFDEPAPSPIPASARLRLRLARTVVSDGTPADVIDAVNEGIAGSNR